MPLMAQKGVGGIALLLFTLGLFHIVLYRVCACVVCLMVLEWIDRNML
jgi:hypothetical protein